LIVAALFVIVPFWTWYGTWFGRPLNDEQIARYLGGQGKPRQTQHALLQIEQRLRKGDPAAKRWYPQVASLAGHPVPEIRLTAAWVMGQDNTFEGFHQALLRLLEDGEPMVRRNAALGLVRFQDQRGHPELMKMLQPFAIQAPGEGTATVRLKEGEPVTAGALVARLHRPGAAALDVRSPLPGYVSAVKVQREAQVMAGQELVVLAPDKGQVWEALRALYLVGQPGDLPEVERYARGVADMPDRIKQQAALTAGAIRKRSEQKAESRE
jgi:HEAT repeat protein